MGLVVDAVCDIITVDPDQVQDAPTVSDQMDADFVRGVITIGDDIVTLLDLGMALPESAQAA